MSSDSPTVESSHSNDSVRIWLQSIEPRLQETSLNAHEQRINRYTEFIDTNPVKAEFGDVVAFFRHDLDGLAASTITAYKTTVKLYHQFVESDVRFDVTPNLSKRISIIDPKDYADPDAGCEICPLTPQEVEAILSAAYNRSPRHALTVLLLLSTGMRRREAAVFTPDWLDLEDNFVNVLPSESVSFSIGDRRTISITPGMAARLDTLISKVSMDAYRISPSTVYDRVRTAGEDADLRVSPRRLRHTFAARLQLSGLPLNQIAYILGIRFGRHQTYTLEAVDPIVSADEDWDLFDGIDFEQLFDD